MERQKKLIIMARSLQFDVAIMITQPLHTNKLLYVSFMKSCYRPNDKKDTHQGDGISDEDFKFLLKKKDSILANRDYYSWDKDHPQGDVSACKEGYNKQSSTLISVVDEKSEDQEAQLKISSNTFIEPKVTQIDYAPLPDLDLSGLSDYDTIFEERNKSQSPELEHPDSTIFTLEGSRESNSGAFSSAYDTEGFFDTSDLTQEELDDEEEEEDENLELLALLLEKDIPKDDVFSTDWLDLAPEADSFEAFTDREDFGEVDTDGAVSREERALQAAIEIGETFDLEKDEVVVIANIFEQNGWSACRVAITRELSVGSDIFEL